MVAYSFQRQFIEPIRDRVKPHTIRAKGKRRHARPGEQLQLYAGMRTSSCVLIGRARCDRLQHVQLDFGMSSPILLADIVEGAPGDWQPRCPARPVQAVEAFAISDGFEDLEAMARFWRDVHRTRHWKGLLIGWDVTTLVLPGAAAEEVRA